MAVRMKMIKKPYGTVLAVVFLLLFVYQFYTLTILSPRRAAAAKSFDYVRWLKESEEEIRSVISRPFNSTYKNPCWYKDGKLFCVPYFYLAGMPKCGTTDLYAKITKHPHITICAWNPEMRSTCICRKEPHWWGKHRFKPEDNIGNYLRHWFKFALRVEANYLPRSKQIVGDGSASTFWQLANRQDSSTPSKSYMLDYTTAHLLRDVQPDAKFIVIFRDPSERLYSNYNYQRERVVKSPEDFHESVEYSIAKVKQCVERLSIAECTYLLQGDGSNLWMSRIYLGWYDVFVQGWLRAFPMKQFLFLRLEDWKKDCENILPTVYNFLAVDQLPVANISGICKNEAENVNKLTKERMLPQTKKMLDEFYRPNLQKLAVILGDNRFLWKD